MSTPPIGPLVAAPWEVLGRLLDSRFATHEMDPRQPAPRPPQAEWKHVAQAVAKRRHEFAAGRHCARQALARLGAPVASVAVSPDRAPQWPAGYVGSISHTDHWCGAAVAPRSAARGVGIDGESDAPLPDELVSLICVPEELAWLGSRPVRERGVLAKAVFSAKEAAYKAQYPLTRRVLEFTAMTVRVDLDAGTLTASLRVALEPVFAIGDVIGGRCCHVPGLVVTAAVID